MANQPTGLIFDFCPDLPNIFHVPARRADGRVVIVHADIIGLIWTAAAMGRNRKESK